MDSNNSTATTTTKSYFGFGFITFLAITVIYFKSSYQGKISYKPYLFETDDKKNEYKFSNYSRTFLYFLVIFVIQICIAWTVVSATNCSMTNDKGKVINEVFKSTAFPWLFIFGLSVVVVLLKPNIKSVFSNVYGYMWVSSSVNSHLVAILKNEKEVKALAASATPGQPSVLQNTADAILKICGNTGILINQITPDNFIAYMKMLQPLMKDNYGTAVLNFDNQRKSNKPDEVFQYNAGKLNAKGAVMGGFQDPDNIFYKLFEVVERRDSIGEYAWYIYTALFVIAIVSYNIAMIPCR